MKFDYFGVSLPERSRLFGHTILRPIIPIKIAAGIAKVDYAALIDSGADFCIFDAAIGEHLGLDVRSGQKELFSGVQNSTPSEAYLHSIALNIGGWNFQTTIGFSYDIAKDGYGILGQKGFFDIFTVKFDLLKEEIELKERK